MGQEQHEPRRPGGTAPGPGPGHPVWANAHRVTEFLYVGGSLRSGDADPATVLGELRGQHGVTHILDCRTETSDARLVAAIAPEVVYHQAGTEDEADGTAEGWFDSGVAFAREALKVPGSVLLAHCALGQTRGPSMAFAVLLDQGYDPGEALLMITQARPQAKAHYAEHALEWHLDRTGASEGERRAAFESLRAARGRTGGWHHRRH
ncbi:MAG: dual specificity protein phosphatase family protein [Candidatus Nanopelagicales bacterium]|nr:dual specificity protein phosphatase family protein [Candidatus Nanopelagicales bacterium]